MATSRGRVAIVTDSTASLPAEVAARRGILVVPLRVVVGARALEEGSAATHHAVARALAAFEPVSTSRPAPAAFSTAYAAALDAGAKSIVSIHLSSHMSGTYESALAAARGIDAPVEVVDSAQIGLATGFAVLAAADATDAGADAGAAADAACARADACASYFYVDTLEYLRRGGRLGAAVALLGSALAVKPLLTVLGGRVEPLEKVRTTGRALARIEELAVEAAGSGEVDVGVQHLAAGPRAAELAARLRQRLPRARLVWELEVGAVVGAHVGPGAVAVVVAPHDG
jgi:DegV family protein with EDD domain